MTTNPRSKRFTELNALNFLNKSLVLQMHYPNFDPQKKISLVVLFVDILQ